MSPHFITRDLLTSHEQVESHSSPNYALALLYNLDVCNLVNQSDSHDNREVNFMCELRCAVIKCTVFVYYSKYIPQLYVYSVHKAPILL